MKTLVIGGTGTVGSQVVLELVRRKQAVRVLVTSAEKGTQLPAGVEAYIGNLELPATLPKAFEDVDRVFLVNQRSRTELAQGMYAVAAAQRAGVRKIVYQSLYHVRRGASVPHFHPKMAIENAILRTGMNHTFICPTNFFQNDFRFAETVVEHGFYNQPIGNIGLNRVDVRDVAEAAVNVLLSDEWNNQSIPLAGPDSLTGHDTAQILSEQLGYPVHYAGDDLNAWATQMKQQLPAWLVADWVETYRFIQTQGMPASPEDLALLTTVLGRAPRSYADFVAEAVETFGRPVEAA